MKSLKSRSKIIKKLKENIFYLFFILLFCFRSIHLEAEVSITLTTRDQKSLVEFFHAVLWGSEVGYVLYGEKPICVESYRIGPHDYTGRMGHRISTSIGEGIRAWKKLDLPSETPEFIFLIKEIEEDEEKYGRIIFINKKAFRKAFFDHLPLFKYVFGPRLTEDKFLFELKNSKQDFFSFLRKDNVLIGILLGFGLENSLHVSRSENIRELLEHSLIPSKHASIEDFIILKIKNKKEFSPPIEYFPLSPSLGYSSLRQEIDVLDDHIIMASDALERYSPKLLFGKTTDSDSSNSLIESYERVQLNIINVLDYSQWLEKILAKFYGEPVRIIIEDKESTTDNFFIDNKINIPGLMARAIYQRFKDHFEDKNDKDLSQLIDGMKEAETRRDAHYSTPYSQTDKNPLFLDYAFFTGFQIWSYYKFNNKQIALSSVITQLKNLQKVEDSSIELDELSNFLPLFYRQLFQNIEDHENDLALSHFKEIEKIENAVIKCLAANRLLYQQIKPGSGAEILKDQVIKVSYTLKTLYGNIIEDYPEGISLDLPRTIKAFRMGFPSMRVGEQGILFIHPEWGIKDYLTPPYISPYLIAEFKILD